MKMKLYYFFALSILLFTSCDTIAKHDLEKLYGRKFQISVDTVPVNLAKHVLYSFKSFDPLDSGDGVHYYHKFTVSHYIFKNGKDAMNYYLETLELKKSPYSALYGSEVFILTDSSGMSRNVNRGIVKKLNNFLERVFKEHPINKDYKIVSKSWRF